VRGDCGTGRLRFSLTVNENRSRIERETLLDATSNSPLGLQSFA
jgi:hypothetical protein